MIDVLFTPDGVHELRVLKAGPRIGTISGYYDSPDRLAEDAAALDGWQPPLPGIYLTANPVDPALRARCANTYRTHAELATADHDIVERRWLILDLDPVRPTGIPSTETEYRASHERGRVIAEHLAERGWPAPVVMASGNGTYLLYRIQLPNDPAALDLVNGCLTALAAKFDDDLVHVDTTMGNAARIIRVPGTTNRKGSGTADRPHRLARVLGTPTPLAVVERRLLEALAAGTPPETPPETPGPPGGFDLELFVATYLPDAKGPKAKAGGDVAALWEIPVCPFDPDHASGEAYVGRMKNGALFAGCHHNSCTWGWRELRERLDPGYASAGALVPPPTAPLAVARVVAADFRSGDQPTLWRWRGGWMEWAGPHWAESEPAVIESRLYRRLENAVCLKDGKPAPWAPSRRKVGDVAHALGAITLLPSTVDTPCWLAGDDGQPTTIACANGLLDLGTRQLRPHDPRHFNLVSVPFDYDPQAAEPAAWLAFCDALWPGDSQSVAALQEWFGYVLSGRTHLQKILLIVGPRRGGKGTIARMLERLVGKGSHVGLPLASLAANFGLQPLVGKPLTVIPDARLGRGEPAAIVERLLSISGEDTLTVDRKYREHWTGKLPTRVMILSNELPNFSDASGAIVTRFVTLRCTRSWLGEEDTELETKLTAELPGILNWALAGLDRLAVTGRLTEPEASRDAMVAMADAVSPESAFVRDRCEVGPGCEVEPARLFAAWQGWCQVNGIERPGTRQTFGRKLRAVVPAIRTARPRTGDGGQVRTLQGITLRDPDKTDVEPRRVATQHIVSSMEHPDPPLRGTRNIRGESRLFAAHAAEAPGTSDGIRPARDTRPTDWPPTRNELTPEQRALLARTIGDTQP